MSEPRNTRTVVAKRSPSAPVETEEVGALVRADGGVVVATVTQTGPERPGSYLGAGRVEDLAEIVAERGAGRVVVDGDLTPSQHRSLASALPEGTGVVDRYRLVLGIFEEQAGTRRAQLQVELARLRYELPRLIEGADEGLLNEGTEKGSPVYDVRDRIDRLESKLQSLPDTGAQFREQRREEGFDLVTIAGYTNAGKSTLLHRFADDLSLEAATEDVARDGSQKDATAAVEDRLFETLETTTRRATIDGRPVLATDTVGFVDDLPHDLVASFSSTLSEAAAADAVVLVADASDPPDRFRDRLAVSLEALEHQGVERGRLVPVLNKVDRLPTAERTRRRSIATDLLPAAASDPIPASVLEDTNLEAVRDAIRNRLPTERATLRMQNGDDAMSVVSRAYDRTSVETVEYDGDTVTLVCRGRPSVIERLRASADGLS